MPNPPPLSFQHKKSLILAKLSVPISEYDDLSPKGSIDIGIRELIDEINATEGCVTTSSCAGRVSVFLEGRRKVEALEGLGVGGEGGNEGEGNGNVGERGDGKEDEGGLEGERTNAGVGGKGGGGRWLFVSHDPVPTVLESQGQSENESESETQDGSGNGNGSKSSSGKGSWTELLGLQRLEGGDEAVQREMESVRDGEMRLVHFKFEPMILHVLTASLPQAQLVLSAALQAGFRESGALNLTSSTTEPATPMVGIRSMGLSLESVIGFESAGREICMVPEWQLKHLVEVTNQRFVENGKRIERFRGLLREMGKCEGKERRGDGGGEWEDKEARRERKRAEGLKRAEELRMGKEVKHDDEMPDLNVLDQNP
ncbi:hypothetical protein ACEPPN_002152 [Leptodophora sp. 'Broadleaf-Isolate-01']